MLVATCTLSATEVGTARLPKDQNLSYQDGQQSRDKPHSKGNGSIPGRSHQKRVVPAPAPPSPEVAKSPQPQANYMNITPQVPEQEQQTYETLKPGHGTTAPVVGGGLLYANLVFQKTSTPKEDTPDNDHHAVLLFSSSAYNTPAPRESSKTANASPPPADSLLERDQSATAVAAAGPPPAAKEPVPQPASSYSGLFSQPTLAYPFIQPSTSYTGVVIHPTPSYHSLLRPTLQWSAILEGCLLGRVR